MSRFILLFQAAPFCFGPISTLLNIVRALANSGQRLIVIAEGPTGDLIQRSNLPVECIHATTSQPFSPELTRLVKEADLVISNTDPLFAAACIEQGAHVAVIDTLYWMWDQLPAVLFDADLFICQDFAGVDAQLERLGRPRQFHRVGPLISPQSPPLPLAERAHRIHVSFGGCDCALVDPRADPYPPAMLRLLEEVAATALPEDYEIIACCGEQSACLLSDHAARIKVQTLSNADYLDSLRSAQVACLSPGLTGAMEVFEAGTPVFFLPPQNYSQVLQLNIYRQASVAPHSFTWSDVYPEFDLPPYMEEAAAVARVRAVIQRFVHDPPAAQVLRERLIAFWQYGFRHYDPASGRRLRASLGLHAAEKAAALIEDWLHSRMPH